MKGKLSLVAATAVTALAVGVPVALAGGQLGAASQPVDAAAYFHDNELTTAAAAPSDSIIARYHDAFERTTRANIQTSGVAFFRANELATAASAPSEVLIERYHDAFERTAGANIPPSGVAFFRANELATAAAATPTTEARTSVENGTSIGWTQIGIALGVGLLLSVGLVVAVRLRPGRPLAQ